MIALFQEAGLPEPEFRQDGGMFVQTLWRNWLTTKVVEGLGLDERQKEVIRLVRRSGRISNTEYQNAFAVSKPTATRDLEVLRRKQVLVKVGHTGKGTHYVLNPKGLTKGSKGSSKPKGSHRAQRIPGADDGAVAKPRKKQSTPTVKRSMKGTKR